MPTQDQLRRMRLNPKRITKLQKLLKEELGLDYSDEEAQEAGIAIMRFVMSKHRRQQLRSINNKKEVESEKTKPES